MATESEMTIEELILEFNQTVSAAQELHLHLLDRALNEGAVGLETVQGNRWYFNHRKVALPRVLDHWRVLGPIKRFL